MVDRITPEEQARQAEFKACGAFKEFSDAIAGINLEIRTLKLEVGRLSACPRCHGSGSILRRDGPDECPECGGSGRRFS